VAARIEKVEQDGISRYFVGGMLGRPTISLFMYLLAHLCFPVMLSRGPGSDQVPHIDCAPWLPRPKQLSSYRDAVYDNSLCMPKRNKIKGYHGVVMFVQQEDSEKENRISMKHR
jgi:hypothetical protein